MLIKFIVHVCRSNCLLCHTIIHCIWNCYSQLDIRATLARHSLYCLLIQEIVAVMASIKPTYDFITPPDNNLVCSICLEVAKDPKQHEDCGKLFCSECIEKNGRKPCPNCRAENPKYFKDKRGELIWFANTFLYLTYVHAQQIY